MSMSGIALAEGFDLEEFHSLSWAQVRVANDEFFELSQKGMSDTLEEAFSAAGSTLQNDSVCFLLIRLTQEGSWMACLHVPPAAKVLNYFRQMIVSDYASIMRWQPRQKMIYSASFEALKRQLQVKIELSLQGSEPADFSFEEYSDRLNSVSAREGNMTIQEQSLRDLVHDLQYCLLVHDLQYCLVDLVLPHLHDLQYCSFVPERAELLEAASQTASRSGASSGGSAGVGLGMSEEAAAAVSSFGTDAVQSRLLLRIDLTTEVIQLVRPAVGGDPFPLGESDHEPLFGLLRHQGYVVFVYCCAADCKVRAKMIYSAAKGSFVASAAELGVTIEHKMEADSVAEVTASAVNELIANAGAPPPSVVAPQVVQRPGGKRRSRPPRGS